MSNSILFAPLLPPLWLAVMGAFAAVLCAFALYRRAKGAVARIALFALLLLSLANPSLVKETREPIKDKALIVVDDSASMALGNRKAQVAQAVAAITQKLAGFTDLDVETIHVAGDHETDLFQAIEQKRGSIAADRLAGIIALTDGQVHDAPASTMPAPFHPLIAGQKREIDRRITLLAAPAYGIVGQKVQVKLRITDDPEPQSDSAAVTISHDDGTEQLVNLPVGKDVSVDLPIAHGGPNHVAFAVEAAPHEITLINNVAMAGINGIRDRLRVLLVSGQPSIGGRQWLNLLKGDAAVDLVNFTILRSPFKDNSVPNSELSLIAFPAKEIFETKLRKFDLVIFDGFSSRLLVPDSYLNNIAAYVEDGGALLLSDATGQQVAELDHSPLARILPVTPDGEVLTGSYQPTLSDMGKHHPVTATLGAVQPVAAWSPWFRQMGGHVDDADSEILLTGLNQKPLLVLAHKGQGRVAQFLSNQFWLWPRDYPSGGPEAEMLRRTAHWLMKEPELDETALHAVAEKKDEGWQLSITRQSLKDEGTAVIVTGPDNQPRQVNLTAKDGLLQATVPVSALGLYHVKDNNHDVLVLAGDQGTPEFTAMVATDKVLAPVAEASDGAVIWLDDYPNGPEIRRTDKNASQHGHDWIGLKKNGLYRVTGSGLYPLWPAWLALAVVLIVAMGMWRREGR